MNAVEINSGSFKTLATYVESTAILTVVTAWVVIALQEHNSFHPGGRDILSRVAWPVFYGYGLMKKMMTAVNTSLGRPRTIT